MAATWMAKPPQVIGEPVKIIWELRMVLNLNNPLYKINTVNEDSGTSEVWMTDGIRL